MVKKEVDGWQHRKNNGFQKRRASFYPFAWKRRAFALAKIGWLRDALSDIQMASLTASETAKNDEELAQRLLLEADIQEQLENHQAAIQVLTRGVSLLQQIGWPAQLIAVHQSHLDEMERQYLPLVYPNAKRLDSADRLPAEIMALHLETPALRESYYISQEALTRYIQPPSGLLPSIASLARTRVPTHKLVRVELTVTLEDDLNTMTEWFQALESVEWLKITATRPLQSMPKPLAAIRSAQSFAGHQAPDLKPHNMDLKNGPHGIQHDLFRVLSHNYEWCPKLRSISLTHCVTEPSDILLYLSCRRIKGLDVAPIEEIRLDRCSYIDDLLYDMVKSDLGVSVFETQDYEWMTRRMWRQLCLDAKHQRRGQHRQ